MSHLLQLGHGELGQKNNAGRVKDVREGLEPFPLAVYEEGAGLEAILLSRQGFGEAVAIAGRPAQFLPEVAGYSGNRQLTKTQPGGDVEGTTLIALAATQHEAVLELGHESGIDANRFQLGGCKNGSVST